MALTPDEVVNKQFQVTKFREGYDQDEVDDFLDEIVVELRRLAQENDELKNQLASAQAGESGASATDPQVLAENESLKGQLANAQAQIAQLQSSLSEAQAAAQSGAQQTSTGSLALDGMNSAEYLQLARRVHEEHVREGVAKRDALIAEGESTAATLVSDAQEQANSLVSEAQSRADSLVSEAQAKADSLVSEAQATRDAQLASLQTEVSELESTRSTLQRSVDELQEFERNYRASLRSYLEGQLNELEHTGVEPARPSTPTSFATPADGAGGAAAGGAIAGGSMGAVDFDAQLDTGSAPSSVVDAGSSADGETSASTGFDAGPIDAPSGPEDSIGGDGPSATYDIPEVGLESAPAFPAFGDPAPSVSSFDSPGFASPFGSDEPSAPPQPPYPGLGGH